MKPLRLALLCSTFVFASGCGGASGPSTPVGPNTVRMAEYEFEPSHLVVRRGAEITVENVGEIAHNLTVERGPNPRTQTKRLIGTSSFLPGKSERLEVDLAPGRYVMACTVPGHRELGMVGALTVK